MQRSNKQGNYYFGVLIGDVIKFYEGKEIELVKDLLQYIEQKTGKQFALDKEFIHEVFKLMFNDGESTRFKDITLPDGVLTGTVQMQDYWQRIREFYLHNKGHLIPEPNEIPLEAYEQI